MPLSTEYQCFEKQSRIIPFLVGITFVQRRHLNPGVVVVVGILIWFFFVGVVGDSAGVETSTGVW